MKQKMINGDEFDAVYARQLMNWKPGELKRIKRALNKRHRREWKNGRGSGISMRLQNEAVGFDSLPESPNKAG